MRIACSKLQKSGEKKILVTIKIQVCGCKKEIALKWKTKQHAQITKIVQTPMISIIRTSSNHRGEPNDK